MTKKFITSIEVGNDTAASNAFIDFHSGSTPVDYDTRIIAPTGLGTGTNGMGTLRLVAGTLDFPYSHAINDSQSRTVNIHTGVTQSGFTKTVRIGTNSAAGSTTNITIGSTSGTSSITMNGTVSSTGDISAGGVLKSTYSVTNEGGEIQLSLPASGSTLSGPVVIDVYQDRLRIFDSVSLKGAYIDLTAAGASVGSNLLLPSNIAGGSANQILYQDGAGSTKFIVAPTDQYFLKYTTAGGFAWAAGTTAGFIGTTALQGASAAQSLTGISGITTSASATFSAANLSSGSSSNTLTITAGSNSNTGIATGGSLTLSGGSATGSGANDHFGGSVIISAGNANGTGVSNTGGDVTINAGTGTTPGVISIGTTTANSITIGKSAITTTINGGTIHAAGTNTLAPLTLTSGTNLTNIAAGAIEYDGTTLWATPSTNYGRASIPTMIYTSGSGTDLTATAENTLQNLFPAANDTITLPVGTYYVVFNISVVRGTVSTTSAQLALNIRGGGNAAGTFSGIAMGSGTNGGAAAAAAFAGTNITTTTSISAASTTASSRYNSTVTGILRITSAGTIIPQYNLSANLASAGTNTTVAALTNMVIQSIATSGSVAFTGGWG